MARGLVTAGADVAIWGTNPDKNQRAVEDLATSGRRVTAVRCDVSDEQQVISAFARTVDHMGKVDSVFANAGIGGARSRPFTEMTLEEWRSMMAVNLDGAFLTLREGARHLVDRGQGGALIGLSSTSSIHGAPRNEHYAASKTALVAVMRGLAVELARHAVRCNTLVPGWTETPMTEPSRAHEKFVANTTARTPVRRWGRPDDFSAVAVFLADPTLVFHTGDTIVVDGGYTVF